jgi:CRP-like cAMP-binding protein
MELLNAMLQEVYTKSIINEKTEQSENVRALPGIVKLDAEKLVPGHPLLKKLSLLAVKELLVYCLLLRVKHGHTIYKESESANQTSYIILYGKFLLHNSKLGPIGTCNAGDSLGEEGLLEKSTNN